MEDCIFCKIIKKEIDSKIIYEDDYVFAMLDAQPIAPGHTLVLPKNHVSNILELPDGEIESFFSGVKKVTKILEDSLKPDGFTHGINHKVGQAVDHFHFHIIPRWKDDGGDSLHSVVSNIPSESLDNIYKEIKE